MSESAADIAPLAARFATIKTALPAALAAKTAALGADLEARIAAKLSGGLLATKSGVSRGIAHARIQEVGGKTAAHDIVAVKGKALAFLADGKARFAERGHDPFMKSAFDEMHDETVTDLEDVVMEILRTV